MSKIKRVLVVGGGVGGLTAATAFAQRGVEVVLIEKRAAFDVPGVGLGQPANALRVYDAIGVLPQILASGFAYDHMYIFDRERTLLVDHKFQLGDERIPAVCALSRRRLHDILLAAAEGAGAAVRLGTTAEKFEERNDKVIATFADGRSDAFDLVAGFDGIRSTTRQYLYGSAFMPRPSGYGAWRVQMPRRDDVRGMEFLQGVGSKTGAMPLSDNLMYLFHIRPEHPGAVFAREDYVELFKERLAQYGSYVADIRDSLTAQSDIVYSPIEPMMLPWPWHRGRVVIGGDAAHVVPPHLTQGAAMAAEDAYILVLEALDETRPIEERLLRYSKARYARCAFVYSFSRQWMDEEQSVRTEADFAAVRIDLAANASARIAASDRILNTRLF
jgi:2-polyprenyl-6-methoxyphenol hydroxylase-like FAD-dependent oxidoreductase